MMYVAQINLKPLANKLTVSVMVSSLDNPSSLSGVFEVGYSKHSMKMLTGTNTSSVHNLTVKNVKLLIP